MKRLIISSSLNSDVVQEISDFLQGCKLEEEKVIYLRSPGGETYTVEILRSFLENTPNVHLVGFDQISSSALFLMLTVKCKKAIVDGTFSCYHLPYVTQAELNFDMTPRLDIPLEVCKDWGISVNKAIEIMDNNMSSKQISESKEFKDVWIRHKQLKNILKKDENYLHISKINCMFAK